MSLYDRGLSEVDDGAGRSPAAGECASRGDVLVYRWNPTYNFLFDLLLPNSTVVQYNDDYHSALPVLFDELWVPTSSSCFKGIPEAIRRVQGLFHEA